MLLFRNSGMEFKDTWEPCKTKTSILMDAMSQEDTNLISMALSFSMANPTAYYCVIIHAGFSLDC